MDFRRDHDLRAEQPPQPLDHVRPPDLRIAPHLADFTDQAEDVADVTQAQARAPLGRESDMISSLYPKPRRANPISTPAQMLAIGPAGVWVCDVCIAGTSSQTPDAPRRPDITAPARTTGSCRPSSPPTSSM